MSTPTLNPFSSPPQAVTMQMNETLQMPECHQNRKIWPLWHPSPPQQHTPQWRLLAALSYLPQPWNDGTVNYCINFSSMISSAAASHHPSWRKRSSGASTFISNVLLHPIGFHVDAKNISPTICHHKLNKARGNTLSLLLQSLNFYAHVWHKFCRLVYTRSTHK